MIDTITFLQRLVKSKTLVYSKHTFEPVPGDNINLPERTLVMAKMQYGVWPFRSYYYVGLWGDTEHDRKLANHDFPGTAYALVNIGNYDSEREALLETIRRMQKGLQGFANCFGVTSPEIHQRILFSVILGANAPDVRDAPDNFLMGSDLLRGKTQ